MNPLGLPAFIGPYVGGKGGTRYFRQFGACWQSLICDQIGHYDVIVEPFAGSGAATWQHHHGIKNAIAGDIDPGVLAVVKCWASFDLRCGVQWWLDLFREKVKNDPQGAFEDLCDRYNRWDQIDIDPAWRAALYLTLKRLVFGGVLRCNKRGKLNVALSQDKLNSYLQGWQYIWPNNGVERLDIHGGWEAAVQALADGDYSNALVVIDPPYYDPQEWDEVRKDGRIVRSRMTAAYPGHNPQSINELEMCVDCLNATLATGKASRIVVFNYWSDELNKQIKEVFDRHYDANRLSWFQSSLGFLGGMNNAQKFHKRNTEHVWEIGGKRMFQDWNAVQQLAFA
ncbi:MAG: DNA adenine methylase [Cyanobacteria bacterium P01_C01_bin.120]